MTYAPLLSAEIPRARTTDPLTSQAAAKRSRTFAESHAGRILESLKRHGYMSAQGIAGMTGLTVVQVDRRTIELQRQGLIEVVQQGGCDLVWGGMRVWKAL